MAPVRDGLGRDSCAGSFFAGQQVRPVLLEVGPKSACCRTVRCSQGKRGGPRLRSSSPTSAASESRSSSTQLL